MQATEQKVPFTRIEHAKLLKLKGRLPEALALLEKEKKELDKKASSGPTLMSAQEMHMRAHTYLLLGQWTQEAASKEPREVQSLFEDAVQIQPK